jgi:hypothetical protein
MNNWQIFKSYTTPEKAEFFTFTLYCIYIHISFYQTFMKIKFLKLGNAFMDVTDIS